VNDHNDDMRRAATKDVPQTREDAASTKAQNRMTAKSAKQTYIKEDAPAQIV
jgi:hypothetical protein